MSDSTEYDFKKIEKKFAEKFASCGTRETSANKKDNFYLLEMFPYPSGALHMGHMRNYTIGDTYKRFLEMKGRNVLYPMGYDSFGLPAENAAIKSGVHPREWTMENIDKMISQQKRMGLSYDWGRLVLTCSDEYIKWNQWFFLKFLEKGLAYRKESDINWCPKCKTVLANEQVHSGRCWRCDSPVATRKLKQWFFKITEYADELLSSLVNLDWPAKVISQQRNWIGKSEGLEIDFPLENGGSITVFTTRPDTLWGSTFMAVSPGHPVVKKIGGKTAEEIAVMKNNALSASEEDKEKIGIRLPVRAVNPVTGEKIPVFAANFVLMEYGTGAIMCVPAHDKRDFAFARKYGIPVRAVIHPGGETLDGDTMREAYAEDGILAESGRFSGMDSSKAKKKISEYLEEKGTARITTKWHLRDWLVSRQRYWGCPIPVVYCDKCGMVPLGEKDLPVLLPDDVDFTGEGNPLAGSKSFSSVKCPKCGGNARRETDTLDTFVDSSWYFLRYLDPKNPEEPFSPEKANAWMSVDQYIGGIEHATMHLIYARFFTKVLRDLGLVKCDEPFKKLLCQGMVLKDGAKMSKSKGNTVSVDEILDKWGADTARLFILFASPPEKDLEWSTDGVRGSSRFLAKVWKLAMSAAEGADEKRTQHKERIEFMRAKTIKSVENDIGRFQFNTAISSIQEFVNFIQGEYSSYGRFEGFAEAVKSVVALLYPFAPFISSELAARLGVSLKKFPSYSGDSIEKMDREIIIQVNGKMRSKITAPPETGEEEITRMAMDDEKIKKFTHDKEIKKTIYVPGRLLNLVTGGEK